ncbi:MAG: DUF6174 domain-containing protein, partial [Acidobacteriota bacterium]
MLDIISKRMVLLVAFLAISLPVFPQADPIADALSKAEASWSRLKPPAYEFTIDVRCFCHLAKTPPRFRVKNGAATALTELTALERQGYGEFDTVEKLFQILRRHLTRKPEMMIVYYDRDLSYPLSAEIDVRREVKDDELEFYVRSLIALAAHDEPV